MSEKKRAYMIGSIVQDDERQTPIINFELRFKTESEMEEDVRGMAVQGSEDADIPKFVRLQDIPKMLEIEDAFRKELNHIVAGE